MPRVVGERAPPAPGFPAPSAIQHTWYEALREHKYAPLPRRQPSGGLAYVVQQGGRQQISMGVTFLAQRFVYGQRVALILGRLSGQQHARFWSQDLGCLLNLLFRDRVSSGHRPQELLDPVVNGFRHPSRQ
jgi:hypothetical protein